MKSKAWKTARTCAGARLAKELISGGWGSIRKKKTLAERCEAEADRYMPPELKLESIEETPDKEMGLENIADLDFLSPTVYMTP
jgi:hypothetical protein